MTVKSREIETYVRHFEALEPTERTEERREAFEKFKEQGFPDRKNENWIYTDPGKLAENEFIPNFQGKAATPSEAGDNDGFSSQLLEQARYVLVFINGIFSARDSKVDGLPVGAGLNIGSASTHEIQNLKIENPFVDLNKALACEGFKINLDAGLLLDDLILLRFIGTRHSVDQAKPVSFHLRSHIILGEGARARIIEEHVGSGLYFSNNLVSIDVHENAELEHVRIQRDDNRAFNMGNTHVRVHGNARYRNFAFNMGSRLARNEIRCQVSGFHADLQLIGLNLVADSHDEGQHLDTTTFIDHAHAETTSSELYKSVLEGSGTGVFQAKIEVQQDSQRIVGNQMSRALMLSPKAQVNVKPELEIYADDVVCSHGATIGNLDEVSLFYLRSRGIPEKEARKMLVGAFVGEILEHLSHEGVQEILGDLVQLWLSSKSRQT